jgi:GNAT superfamily N-acetyltransferase
MDIRPCRPEEEARSWELERLVWNPMNWEAEGSVGTGYFPDLHLLAVDKGDDLFGTIDGCPLRWNGDPEDLPPGGWSEMVLRADALRRETPDYSPEDYWVGAVGTSIDPKASGQGLSARLLEALRDQAERLGYRGLLAPVRPILKARMPWLTIAEYAEVRLPNGRHFDPWIRTHEDLGGQIIATCESSAQFRGSRQQWEAWSKSKLPDSGMVLLPEAIGALELDGGRGRLIEPSVWIQHRSQK